MSKFIIIDLFTKFDPESSFENINGALPDEVIVKEFTDLGEEFYQ